MHEAFIFMLSQPLVVLFVMIFFMSRWNDGRFSVREIALMMFVGVITLGALVYCAVGVATADRDAVEEMRAYGYCPCPKEQPSPK